MKSRRVFLKNGAFALVSLGFAPSFLARTALPPASGAPKQLIAIFQRGAVDGLNMVVPYGEADYYRARPSIAIPRPRAAMARSISTASSASIRASAPLEAVLGPARARRRPRVRLARRDAVALRRAGLHGNGHARRQEHRATAG